MIIIMIKYLCFNRVTLYSYPLLFLKWLFIVPCVINWVGVQVVFFSCHDYFSGFDLLPLLQVVRDWSITIIVTLNR